MDNFKFDMTAEGPDTLKAALSLFNPPGGMVIGYSTNGSRLVLYWKESPRATKLPFPMTLDQAADFASGWLKYADYGDEPDHDGDNDKGWRLYCEDWGHIDRDHCAFAAIEPAWAMYGK